MKRVKFWARLSREKSQEWVLAEGWDASRVPLKAWKAFNKTFWGWKTQGRLYPLDELDAYQITAAEMIRVAENPPELRRASLATYLVSAAYLSLLKHKVRVVDPMREAYRATCNRARVCETEDVVPGRGTGRPLGANVSADRSEDRADREWSDRSTSSLDVQAFVESLPGTHSADGVHATRLAADCVYGTLAKLDADAQAGLRAWIDADGIWVDAARLYNPNGSVQGYVYRFKYRWAPAFRRECQWIW